MCCSVPLPKVRASLSSFSVNRPICAEITGFSNSLAVAWVFPEQRAHSAEESLIFGFGRQSCSLPQQWLVPLLQWEVPLSLQVPPVTLELVSPKRSLHPCTFSGNKVWWDEELSRDHVLAREVLRQFGTFLVKWRYVLWYERAPSLLFLPLEFGTRTLLPCEEGCSGGLVGCPPRCSGRSIVCRLLLATQHFPITWHMFRCSGHQVLYFGTSTPGESKYSLMEVIE